MENESVSAIAFEKPEFTSRDVIALRAVREEHPSVEIFLFSHKPYGKEMLAEAESRAMPAFFFTGINGRAFAENLEANVALKYGKSGVDYMRSIEGYDEYKSFLKYAFYA